MCDCVDEKIHMSGWSKWHQLEMLDERINEWDGITSTMTTANSPNNGCINEWMDGRASLYIYGSGL